MNFEDWEAPWTKPQRATLEKAPWTRLPLSTLYLILSSAVDTVTPQRAALDDFQHQNIAVDEVTPQHNILMSFRK